MQIVVSYLCKPLPILFCIAGIWLQACSSKTKDNNIPTYIHIDSFQLKANPKLPALPVTSHINNVTVYYNNSSIGTFDLPANVPVLAHGDGNLTLSPGILVNGLNEQLSSYPFYKPYTYSLNAAPGKTLTVIPTTMYYDDIQPEPVADFNSKVAFALKEGSRAMTKENGVGVIQLNAAGESSLDSTILPVKIGDGTAYIEFDYKSTIPFSVALQSSLGGLYKMQYVAGVHPSGEWQKFYVNVSDFTAQYKSDNYHFFIYAYLNEGQTSGKLMIDNIYSVTLK